MPLSLSTIVPFAAKNFAARSRCNNSCLDQPRWQPGTAVKDLAPRVTERPRLWDPLPVYTSTPTPAFSAAIPLRGFLTYVGYRSDYSSGGEGVQENRSRRNCSTCVCMFRFLDVRLNGSPAETRSRLSFARRRPSDRAPCARRRRRFGLRCIGKDDVVGHRIIVRHELAHEIARLDAEGGRPDQVTVRRNAAPAVLQLRHERVILGTYLFGQVALRQAAFLAQFAQPCSRLIAQLLRELGGTSLRVRVHRLYRSTRSGRSRRCAARGVMTAFWDADRASIRRENESRIGVQIVCVLTPSASTMSPTSAIGLGRNAVLPRMLAEQLV